MSTIAADYRNLLLYAVKCIAGVLITFALSSLFNYHDISWFIISIVLVLSPDSEEAMPLAITRIKANLIGSGTSAILLLSGLHDLTGICIAFTITIWLCYMFKVMSGSRAALAAVIIIMLYNPGQLSWETALERIMWVAGGCATGLGITYAVDRTIHGKKQIAAAKTME